MNKKIKLIWDFRGPDAMPTAKHHAIHLEEFAKKEKLEYYNADATQISNFLAIAYILVNEKDMIIYRDALKPHRAEVG
ncbi:MAG: hypothetical protein CR989_01495 [Flavobacteriales bacterium]|nr:MAG: hypothetical protein CR989_01495 [Flavobacteriales bacterium]